MATLMENANRIKSGADSIKAWLVARGVAPSGGIETFAAALNDVPNVAIGNFTSNANGHTVDLNFTPKYIAVTVNSGASTYVEVDTWFDGQYAGARGASASSGGIITTQQITVANNSFTHKALNTNFGSKPAKYIAIG